MLLSLWSLMTKAGLKLSSMYFILFSQSYRWGKIEFMPPWWPISLIPFTNPRQDVRPEKTDTC